MRVSAEELLAWPIADVVQRYDERDTMLYALSLGLGATMNRRELRFVYEKDLVALPTMALVLARPGPWAANPDLGIDYTRIVHGEQTLRVVQPLPPQGTVRGTARVTGVVDKGEGRGALIYVERQLHDEPSGRLLAVMESTSFCRGDGGFGGPQGPTRRAHELPGREPDDVRELATSPQTALLYRLNGDRNPLHCDPEVAAQAGFDRPITHGLATYGIAVASLLATACDYEVDRLAAVEARFSAPSFPGDLMQLRLWRDKNAVSFDVLPRRGGSPFLTAGKAALVT